MSNKPTTWIEASKTIQNIIEKNVSDSVHQIQTGSDTHKWVYDKVEECVSNVLFELEDNGKISSCAVWELAEIQRNYYLDEEKRYKHYQPNELDWEKVKESEFRKVKIGILDKIIDRKAKQNEELQPIELFTLESKLDAKDVPVDTRYNVYVDYLHKKIWSLINALRVSMFDDDSEANVKRQSNIRELHMLMTDERNIIMLDENKAWKIVNQAWGLDHGLE